MRLSETQVKQITAVLVEEIPFSFELFLVGSRTKDHLKGGDIDLLLISDNRNLKNLLSTKHLLIDKLKRQPSVDDGKVDLLLAHPDDLINDPFISSLNSSKIKIFKKK